MMACPSNSSNAARRGRLRHDTSLARHTVWGIGGPADHLYEPADLDDLRNFLAALPASEPLFWLGLGSNLLIRDGGIRGTVVMLSRCLNHIERLDPRSVRAEAGVACPKVARFCARHGLAGSAFMAGIPGTVGGALAMNAGAFGGETYDIVQRVELVTRAGELVFRDAKDLNAGYRHVDVPPQEWFVAAHLRLGKDAPGRTQAQIKELLKRRAATQPMGQKSCGSVFRNPPGDHAARLIESCGLKGYRIGDAEISLKHANFIINQGAARAEDVEALIQHIIDAVRRQKGIVLVPEVRVVGEPA